MSSCTTTVPNSVRKSAPVGQTSRQPACVQCLHTSDSMSQRRPVVPSPFAMSGFSCSMNATWRQVFAPSAEVLSYDSPVHTWPSCGMRFHSLHATSQALQPMQTDVSVKKPTRGGWSGYPDTAAGSCEPPGPASGAPGSALISRLRPGLVGDPGPRLVLADQFAH